MNGTIGNIERIGQVRKSSANQELDLLDQALENLAKMVAVLDDRLVPMSKPQTPTCPSEKKTDEQFLPELLLRVRCARERVQRIEDHVRSLDNRLLI